MAAGSRHTQAAPLPDTSLRRLSMWATAGRAAATFVHIVADGALHDVGRLVRVLEILEKRFDEWIAASVARHDHVERDVVA